MLSLYQLSSFYTHQFLESLPVFRKDISKMQSRNEYTFKGQVEQFARNSNQF